MKIVKNLKLKAKKKISKADRQGSDILPTQEKQLKQQWSSYLKSRGQKKF